MRGYPIIFGEGVDPDAYQYFLRAGIASGTQTPTAYDNAASFNGTSQFLSVASNSSLQVTGSSFTFAFWANTPNTSNGMAISKTALSDTREFQIGLNTGGIVEFRLLPDGTFANSRVISTSASSFTANTWSFIVCRYDSSAATIGISVNGGVFTSLGSIPAITQTNTNPLNFGVFVNTSGGLNYTGQLSSVGFWKRALTASEVTQLWNNGAGRTYASLDSGLLTNLISWWALNQTSVTADSHGTNTLTNNGTVTAPNIGPIVTTTQNSRQLINNFVKGIKSLGLWNQMVCWPLRASQNAGTGTTAYSLGGLGMFNGNLVNAPAWGSLGIVLGATNQSVSVTYNDSLLSLVSSYVAFYTNSNSFNHVHTKLETGGTDGIYLYHKFDGQAGFGTSGVYGATTRGGGNTAPNQDTSRLINLTSFQTSAYVAQATSDTTYQDGVVAVNGLKTGLATRNPTGTPSLTLFSNSTSRTQAFQLLSSQVLSNTQILSLNNLYRSTLGLGLGLP